MTALDRLKYMFWHSPLGKRGLVKRILHKCIFQYRLPQVSIEAAEKDDAVKERIVREHAQKHREKTTALDKTTDRLLASLGMPESETLRLDVLFCYYAYGFTPNEYFCYHLQNKAPKERKSFLSDRDSVEIGYRFNDVNAMDVFVDKMGTYQKYRQFFKREAVCIETREDYPVFCEFIARHPVFVKKIVFESCGRSVELVDMADYVGQERELFDSWLLAGKTILEEKVEQSAQIAMLNYSSVNTVRCQTLKIGQEVLVPWCFMRVGQAGSFVDNGGAGGIIVGLDERTGTADTEGVDECGRRFSHHPDSKIPFVGFQIPQWEELLRICKEMAAMEPQVRWIGWDMAHTENGWAVIEGNALTEVIGPQCTNLRGYRECLETWLSNQGGN